ncbi:MAG: hypothetical protein OXC48_02335, partial [Endozoicomonadaceae bacterium]|nr:hypothetical protein [Endozoicomonadaceae bacterium]
DAHAITLKMGDLKSDLNGFACRAFFKAKLLHNFFNLLYSLAFYKKAMQIKLLLSIKNLFKIDAFNGWLH